MKQNHPLDSELLLDGVVSLEDCEYIVRCFSEEDCEPGFDRPACDGWGDADPWLLSE